LEIHSPVTWLEVFDVLFAWNTPLPPSTNPFSANLMAQPTQPGTYMLRRRPAVLRLYAGRPPTHSGSESLVYRSSFQQCLSGPRRSPSSSAQVQLILPSSYLVYLF